MKKLGILSILILLLASPTQSQEVRHKDKRMDHNEIHYSPNIKNLGNGYAKDSWEVFYKGKIVKDASASSFESLGKGGYGKDYWKVFYRGKVLKNASASSFEYLGDGHARDSWNTFYKGK